MAHQISKQRAAAYGRALATGLYNIPNGAFIALIECEQPEKIEKRKNQATKPTKTR